MEAQSTPRKVPGFCSFRYGISVVLHFCNVAVMAQNIGMALTMVSMVNHTDPNGLHNVSVREKVDNIMSPVFNWSPEVQGIILSALSYGTVVVQIPVGYFSGIYRIKPLIGWAILLSSVLSLCIPSLAQFGPPLLIVCRVAQGMAQGAVITAQSQTWVMWSPPLERGRLTSLSASGFSLGPFFVLLASGYICESLGWPMVFYILGAYGCAASLCWFVVFYDDPKDHPCISISEKDYITSSLAQQVSSSGHSLPIKAMLKSLPMWAIIFGYFAMFWSNAILYMYTPTFIHTVLHVNIRENGLLSSLSSLIAYIIGILSGHLGDFLLSRNILSTLAVRKLFTTLGAFCPVVFSMCLLFLRINFHSTVAFLALSGATFNFYLNGVVLNALDIAPRYVGFINGVRNFIGTIGSLTAVTVTGIMLGQDPEYGWHKVFFLIAAINVASTIFYVIFAKADVQDWAKKSNVTRL